MARFLAPTRVEINDFADPRLNDHEPRAIFRLAVSTLDPKSLVPQANMPEDPARQNETWFNESSRSRRSWNESVEHIAIDLHSRAIELGRRSRRVPRVLDLGAGATGLSTYPYLYAGCEVHAVDSAGEALDRLKDGAAGLPGTLTIHAEDIEPFLTRSIGNGDTFDIVVARSFLHHIPDYLQLIRTVRRVISPQGVFVSYEDPPPYNRTPALSLFYSRFSYFSMRLVQGNYLRGLKTRWRRLTGTYRDDLPEDVVEYHIVRNGVDDEQIAALFAEFGFKCEVKKYFTTDNLLTKHLGRRLDVVNSFCVLAYRH